MSIFYSAEHREYKPGAILLSAFAVSLVLIAVMMIVLPQYSVWSRALAGQAQLREAEWNRQIAVQEANAKMESAKALAEAEVIRAGGVARANKIIGDSLKENEQYLRYLWVTGLQTNQMQVIYIPTEAGMPILEAGKR